jgi:putative transcriptional regulator
MKNNIAERRAEFDINQEELAIMAGISRVHLSEIENDKVEPSGKIMFRIARALGFGVEAIFLMVL